MSKGWADMENLAGAVHEGTPLWPAGHLPLKGGDQPACGISPKASLAGKAAWPKRLISPLEGEMAGRPEGGIPGNRSFRGEGSGLRWTLMR